MMTIVALKKPQEQSQRELDSKLISDVAMDNGIDLLGAPTFRRSAFFAADKIRIRLTRDWGPGPRALVIGCNPSGADAEKDDPTSNWWNRWFRAEGFGGYDAMNLYPICSSSPVEARKWADFENNGPDWYARDMIHFNNLPALVKAAKRADQVFVCWGAIAWDDDWIEHVVEEIQTGVEPYPHLWCWGRTKSGAPTHPMARGKHRIPKDARPILWRAAYESELSDKAPSPVR